MGKINSMEYFDKFVSLGRDCHTALMIRCKYFNDVSKEKELFFDEKLFKSKSYPFGSYLFDWVVGYPSGLYKCLESNFVGMTDYENFNLNAVGKYRKRPIPENKLYKMFFHHFDHGLVKRAYTSSNKQKIDLYFKKIFEETIKKYDYLVNKMLDLLNSKQKILFVYNDYKQKTESSFFAELLSLLNNFSCDASLLVVGKNRTNDITQTPKLYFENTIRRGKWNPSHVDEYTSWMKAMENFKMKDVK